MKAYCKKCVSKLDKTITRGYDHDVIDITCHTCEYEVRLEF
jgi:hypothetical protein